MPVVKKSTVKTSARPAKKNSVMNRILSVQDHKPGGMKVNVYGRSGTGKTRFACTFPKPLLLVGFEDGTRSVSTVKGVFYVRVESSEELTEVTREVASTEYKTIVLDTATGLQDTILKEILGVKELPTQRSWGMATREQWGQCAMQTKERLREVLNLSDDDGRNVVTIAQEREFDETGAHPDLMVPFVCSALSPSVVGWLNPTCDFIVQTFIRERTEEVSRKVANKTIVQNEKTGQAEFCLRTAPDPVYTVKFRQPPGAQLPPVVVDPTYKKLEKYLQGG